MSVSGVGGGPQGGRGPGAGAEVADRQVADVGLGAQPAGDVGEPAGEQVDVEHVGPVALLVGGEQVEEQRAKPGLVEHAGDVAVAGAVAAAAAAVGEHHDPGGRLGNERCPASTTAPASTTMSSSRRGGSLGPGPSPALSPPPRASLASRHATTSSSEVWEKSA